MAGKDNAWLLVGLLSLAVWALAGDFASAQGAGLGDLHGGSY